MRTALVCVVLTAGLLIAEQAAWAQESPAAGKPTEFKKLIYISDNFIRPANVDSTIEVLKKAAAAGYTGVLLSDCKLDRWEETVTVQRPLYDDNLKRVRQACRDLKLELIACVLGQNMDLLSNDPNLAEGMPVVDAPFVLRDGRLVPADEDFKVLNGSFEQARRENQPDGWSVDAPGKAGFLDTQVKFEGKQSLRFEDLKAKSEHSLGRANQRVQVKPFRYYYASVMVKTENFVGRGTFNFTVLGHANGLAHQTFDIAPTQDWKKIEIVFNTLDNKEVGIYVGSWGGETGKIWFDDVRVAPGGLVNLIRRDSCPFKVTSADGKTLYAEGKDFSEARDPKLGNVKWPGDYQYWYEQPVVSVPQGSRLKEGDVVLVSYYHAMNTLGWGVFACMAEPKTLEIARRNLANVHKVLEPDGYMLPYDEIRHWGWDPSCEKTGLTAAQMLADNTRMCVEMIRQDAPGRPIYAWNDMFDPHHNAGKNGYDYLVKGQDPFWGSWEGLPKEVLILNWNGDPAKRKQSMKFFADRGHRQILCGFYDAPSENMASWIKDAADMPGISGVMYTTWAKNFSELEKYLKVVDSARNAPGAK